MDRKGFLLIDSLMAVLILSLAFPFIMASLNQAYETVGYSRHFNQALLLAKAKLENYQANPGASSNQEQVEQQGVVYQIRLDLAGSADPALLVAKVTVTWPERRSQGSCELSTLVRP